MTHFILLVFLIIPVAAAAAPPGASGSALFIEKTPRNYRGVSRHDLNWQYAFRLGGAYSGMLNSYSRSLESGFGFDGDFFARVNRNVSLRFSLGTSGINTNENSGFIYWGGFYPPEYRLIGEKFNYRDVRYFASIQFNSADRRAGMAGIGYFIYFGLGGIYHDASLKTVYEDTINNRILVYNRDLSNTDLAFTAGLGTTFLLDRHWGIDFTFSTDIILGNSGYTTDAVTIPDYDGTYDFKIGLLYLL